MRILRFKFSEISPYELDVKLLAHPDQKPKGSFVEFRRPGLPFHYYTFTDGNVLKSVAQTLKSQGVNFTIVTEQQLPLDAKVFLETMIGAGMKFVNH